MYAAFVALAVAVVLLGGRMLRLEAMRAADAEILDQAGLQRTFSQHAGRLAALLVQNSSDATTRSRYAQALEVLVRRSANEALALEPQLQGLRLRPTAVAQRVGLALEAWQAARERLWYRCEALLRVADDGSEAELRRAGANLQLETEPALQAALQLSAALRSAAAERAQHLSQEVRWGVAAALLLLGLLALVVVEPAARSVRRHARRLHEQASELQRLALVAEHTSAPVLVTNAQDQVQWVNAAFTRSTGWPLQEALGQCPGVMLTHPHADAPALLRVQQALLHGQGVRQECLHRTRDGRDLWLDVDLRPLHNEDHALTGFVRVCSDSTLRVQQQAKLHALWAALPAGVVVQDTDGSIVEANLEAERMLGLSLAQLQGRTSLDPRWRTLRTDGSPCPGEEHPAMRTLASGQPLHNQTLGVHLPDGSVRWLLVNTQPQRDSTGSMASVVACFTDITESRALHDRLASNARTDVLTRLPNRTVVMERLQRAIDHGRRHPGYGFAVLFMDFDRFKQVNDTLGHGAGDELLRQVARRLNHALRPGDAVARMDAPVAARLGGDEFVVVLEGVNDADTVAVIAQRILQDLGEPYLIDNSPVQGSVSVGVVLCTGLASQARAARSADEAAGLGRLLAETPARTSDELNAELNDEQSAELTAEDVLRNADTAMYEAKRAGRGRWVLFDDSMHERVVRALALETDLRRALKEDELFVVYQPVVDLATRALVGVEALVRWRHPTRGLVPPVEFVGVAEESGLIDALGTQVLQKACLQFMQWQHTLGAVGPRQLAVNLSRAQLKNPTLVDSVRQVLQGCGMAPQLLQLEVTESLAAQDERVRTTLNELKALGVCLALDDFGTGYSSLACLHQMPVDTVKVDRSFVKHAETVEYHRVLIEATIRVARTMGMTTVAEGIETEGQAELMRTLACDRGQGYLFSPPLEPADLAHWALAQALQAAATV